MEPHESQAAANMPARKLETYVKSGLKSGAGIEPVAIAKALFEVALRDEKVSLHLLFGATALSLIKSELVV